MKKYSVIFIILTIIGSTMCSVAQKEKPEKPDELPLNFKLRKLSNVVQEGSYCVPASAEVIARFHGIETDQWEIAKLSSQDSMDNSGTMPDDMARALENFGIRFHRIEYKHASGDVDDFIEKTLPQFKKALVHEGPMYISIREIFGGNHGCVVIGYNDKTEKMYFYNPWGDEFNLSYKEVAKYSYGAIAFAPPRQLDVENADCTSLIETLKHALPNNAQDIIGLRDKLEDFDITYEFVECNRNDIMDDASKTERLAKREGEKFIDLALERVPAILIPQTDDKDVTVYLLIRKSPESEKKLLVQRIGSQGWSKPELEKPSQLMRYWTTPVDVGGKTKWLLPLFEFSGTKISQQELLAGHIKTSEARAIAKQYVEALMDNDFDKWSGLMLDTANIDSKTFNNRLNKKQLKRINITDIVMTKTGVDICLVFDPPITIYCENTSTSSHPGYWVQMIPNGKIKYDIYIQHPIYRAALKCSMALHYPDRDFLSNYLEGYGIPAFGYDKNSTKSKRWDSLIAILEWLQDDGAEWDLTEPKVPLAADLHRRHVLLEKYSPEQRKKIISRKW